jgi:hypothetical protein
MKILIQMFFYYFFSVRSAVCQINLQDPLEGLIISADFQTLNLQIQNTYEQVIKKMVNIHLYFLF